MNRIDPTAIPDVFRRRGLVPSFGDWFGEGAGLQCCVLSALYCDARSCEDPETCFAEIDDIVEQADDTIPDGIVGPVGLDPEYARGVAGGWDNGSDVIPGYEDLYTPEYLAGRRDGVGARRCCEAPGIVPDAGQEGV